MEGEKQKSGISAWWSEKWGGFSERHPVAAKWLYQIFYFYVFSLSVTILQYILFTTLPYAFGERFAAIDFMWPRVPMHLFGVDFTWSLLGYEVSFDAVGAVVIGGGLGYFLSYEIGSFVAQCINFPLQRNITFKSHGKVLYQAFWYLIAWICISLTCNAINNLWMPIAKQYVSLQVYNILVTVITGGVSMVIYFFAYKIIFPEGQPDQNKDKEEVTEKNKEEEK